MSLRTVRKVANRLVAAGLTLLVVTAAVVGVVTLRSALAERAQAAKPDIQMPFPRATTARFEWRESLAMERIFVGELAAPQEASLAFDIAGTIADVAVNEGDRVAAGAALAELDTDRLNAALRRLEARRNAVAAQIELARLTYDRQVALQAQGHVSDQRLDEARLRLADLEARGEEIAAEIAAIDVDLEKSVLRAPYNGRVAVRHLDMGHVAGPGVPVVTLLEDGPAEIRVGVPDQLVADVLISQSVRVKVADQIYEAAVKWIAPAIEPTTRLVTVTLTLPPSAPEISGLSAEVLLPDERPLAGGWVPLSALKAGPRGLWTLLVVEPSSDDIARIAARAVEVEALEADRAFVSGDIDDGARFVVEGVHRFSPGDTIRNRGASS